MLLATEKRIERAPAPVCLFENLHRLVDLWDMYQVYAHHLLKLIEELRSIEGELTAQRALRPHEVLELTHRTGKHMGELGAACKVLELSSSIKQVQHIIDATINDQKIAGDVLSGMFQELRRRIREDLSDQVFFCIPGPIAMKFFNRYQNGYQVKVASEVMDSSITERFPAASDDIEAACKCYIFDCHAACVFHLMRIVEIGVLKLAALISYRDPKPSWGSILKQVERLVLRTNYADLDPSIQPHRKFLEDVLPEMQAIQRAWRNKVSHAEDKLVPIEAAITEPIAREIMVAVEVFMRQLAHDLPEGV